MFDDCLCFAVDIYFMYLKKDPVIYEMEIDEDEIIDVAALYDEGIIKHISDVIECDLDVAESLLDGTESIYGLFSFDEIGGHSEGKTPFEMAEMDWFIQARQGECAKKMGYEACAAEDEQGTVYIVPMYGRDADLVEIE